jgi:hypothetical protein
MHKEAVVAQLKLLSRHLTGGTEENHWDLNQDSRSSGPNLDTGPQEYEQDRKSANRNCEE